MSGNWLKIGKETILRRDMNRKRGIDIFRTKLRSGKVCPVHVYKLYVSTGWISVVIGSHQIENVF